MKKLTLLISTTFLLGIMASCDKEDDDNGSPNGNNGNGNNNELTVPDTYNWNDVDYAGQTNRIKLLDMLSGEIGKAGEGKTVNEQTLIDIYENNGAISANDNLAEKTYPQDKQMFYDWFAKIDSLTNNPNTNDTIIDGRHFTADGVEIAQMVEKGLMGACFYWQATSDYLHELGTETNENPQEGSKATTREHHFDEAFGYLGVPKNFLDNTQDEKGYTNSTWFWGHYIRSRNGELQNKETIFNAFLKGRAAITQQMPEKRKEAVNTIKRQWELLAAANVAHYINSTLSDMENNATGAKWHHWSEAKAFHMSLKYNTDKIISNSDWQYIDDKLGESPKNISQQDLEDANRRLAQVYDFPTNITNF